MRCCDREKRLTRQLAGLILLDRGVLREGYPVFDGETKIGEVSSGTYSPTLNQSIGMAFILPGKTVPGTRVEVVIRGKTHRAQIVKTPFYRRKRDELGNSGRIKIYPHARVGLL